MLRRNLPPSRKTAIKRVLVRRRHKATGPDPATVEICLNRARRRCEVCGCALGPIRGLHWSIHHRLPRRMGGTRRAEVNRPSALVVTCGSGTTGCHGWIESRREESYDCGLLLRAGETPAEIPVALRIGVVHLADDGTWEEAA